MAISENLIETLRRRAGRMHSIGAVSAQELRDKLGELGATRLSLLNEDGAHQFRDWLETRMLVWLETRMLVWLDA